jgi:hypothetical protein
MGRNSENNEAKIKPAILSMLNDELNIPAKVRELVHFTL